MVSMHEDYALFLNLSGDRIESMNQTLGELGTTEAKNAIKAINQRTTNNFGCAPWIHHLGHMKDYDTILFKTAIRSALDNFGPKGELKLECAENLKNFGVLN